MIKRNKVKVTKRFTFEACHKLVDYEGACHNPHGHSYKMNVTVEGLVDHKGFVVDFKDLKSIVEKYIIELVDHQDLNEVMPKYFGTFGNTTCESMIIAFWTTLEWAINTELPTFQGIKLKRIQLWETEGSFAELTDDMIGG